MTHSCNPQVNFYHSFRSLNLVMFWPQLLPKHLLTLLRHIVLTYPLSLACYIDCETILLTFTCSLYLLVSPADNQCKQFDPRSSKNAGADLDPNFLTLRCYSQNTFCQKIHFEKKKQQKTKQHAKLASRQRV